MPENVFKFAVAVGAALLIATCIAGPAVEPLLAQLNCTVRIDKAGATAPTSGGTFTVTAFPDPAGCSFQVSVLTPGVGTIVEGPGNTAIATVWANPGTVAREARFQIGDQVFRVVQAGEHAQTPWSIGDVFIGAGSEFASPGIYKTLTPQGALKRPDLLDGAGFYSSGCIVDPAAAHGNGHLFTASWRANTLSVFDGVTHQLRDVFPFVDPKTIHPYDAVHQDEVGVNTLLAALPRAAGVAPLPIAAIGVADDPLTTADEFVTPEIQAFEQVAFAADGQLYVGTQTPPPALGMPGLGHGYVLRFRYDPLALPADRFTLTGWWRLDAGAAFFDETTIATSGVDQFDLSERGTIFYTSEDGFIRSFNVNVAGGAPSAVRLKAENGEPLGVRAYGIRILPGALDGSGNATGDGSAGFLVATSGDIVVRADAQGNTIARYGVPNPFALNLTPDAQFFWTADQMTGEAYRFHIASGAREKFVPGAPGIFGLCVKREYSAATSGGQCFNLKDDGSYSADDTVACRTPTICSATPGTDKSGQPNDDCFAPGFSPPLFENQGPHTEGTVVNLDLKRPGITIGGVMGLDAIEGLAYSGSGVITGTIATSACSPPPADRNDSATCTFELSVKWVPGTGTTNILHWIVTPFTWKVTHGNAVPTLTLTNPQPVPLTVFKPAMIQVKAEDRDYDYVLSSVTGLPPGLSAPFRTWAGDGWWLKIEGVPVADPNHGPAYPVRVDVWDCSEQQAEATNLELRMMRLAGATAVEIDAALRAAVADALQQGSCYHDATTLSFTVTMVNHPPTLNPAAQATLVNTPVSYQIPANDADDHPLTWTIENLPTGLSMSATGVISGAPTQANVFDVEVTVTDGAAAPVSSTFSWTVFSNQPPVCSSATATPRVLWPANHQLVPFSIENVTDPDGDALTIVITLITQNQPVNDKGDGTTGFDATGVGTSRGAVRAENTRTLSMPGDGRVYVVHFTANDGKTGGTCDGTVEIAVPHDQGRRATAVPNECRWNSVTGEPVATCAWLNPPVLPLSDRRQHRP